MNPWTDADKAYIWHPFTQMKTAPEPMPVTGASMEFLHLADGRQLIDGISSWWVTLHGHSYPKLVKAFQQQAEILDQVIFAGFTHEPAARLAERLVRRWDFRLPKVFFSDNGSTAVEVAIKMSVQSRINQGYPKKNGLVALDNAYHGDTLGAMSAGERGPFTAAFNDLLFPVYRIHSPAGQVGPSTPADGDRCLSELEALLREKAHEISAVIVEPLIHGAGGMRMWTPGVLSAIRKLTLNYDVHLIADEVMTGFGRTGTFFACDREEVTPDLVCLSKGITGGMMPLSVTMATKEIYDSFLSDDRLKTFFHGHSYTANPLACAVANASLDVFEQEPVFDRIRTIESFHNLYGTKWQDLPIADYRVLGSIAAIELKTDDAGYFASAGQKLYSWFLESGVLIRPLGHVIYLMPPYCTSENSLEKLHEAILTEFRKLMNQSV